MPIQLNESSLTEHEYTPEGFEEESNPPVFVIRPPDEALKTKLSLMAERKADTDSVDLVLNQCVIGWKNVLDAKGNESKFNRYKLRFIPNETRLDLFTEAMRLSRLDEDQKKT